MAHPSKFTEGRRQTILEALRIGSSRATASKVAGVDPSQLTRWLARGEKARDDSEFRRFYDDVTRAESEPKLRALGVIWRSMPDRPDLAWKFVERREPGFAPPERNVQPQIAVGPVSIELSLPGQQQALPRSVTETLEPYRDSDSA